MITIDDNNSVNVSLESDGVSELEDVQSKVESLRTSPGSVYTDSSLKTCGLKYRPKPRYNKHKPKDIKPTNSQATKVNGITNKIETIPT